MNKDCLYVVFSFSQFIECMEFRLVSKEWNEVYSFSNALWKEFFLNEFTTSLEDFKGVIIENDFKKTFFHHYNLLYKKYSSLDCIFRPDEEHFIELFRFLKDKSYRFDNLAFFRGFLSFPDYNYRMAYFLRTFRIKGQGGSEPFDTVLKSIGVDLVDSTIERGWFKKFIDELIYFIEVFRFYGECREKLINLLLLDEDYLSCVIFGKGERGMMYHLGRSGSDNHFSEEELLKIFGIIFSSPNLKEIREKRFLDSRNFNSVVHAIPKEHAREFFEVIENNMESFFIPKESNHGDEFWQRFSCGLLNDRLLEDFPQFGLSLLHNLMTKREFFGNCGSTFIDISKKYLEIFPGDHDQLLYDFCVSDAHFFSKTCKNHACFRKFNECFVTSEHLRRLNEVFSLTLRHNFSPVFPSMMMINRFLSPEHSSIIASFCEVSDIGDLKRMVAEKLFGDNKVLFPKYFDSHSDVYQFLSIQETEEGTDSLNSILTKKIVSSKKHFSRVLGTCEEFDFKEEESAWCEPYYDAVIMRLLSKKNKSELKRFFLNSYSNLVDFLAKRKNFEKFFDSVKKKKVHKIFTKKSLKEVIKDVEDCRRKNCEDSKYV